MLVGEAMRESENVELEKVSLHRHYLVNTYSIMHLVSARQVNGQTRPSIKILPLFRWPTL